MAYLLIYDLDSRSNVRRRINRYLKRNAQMVQHSVWRFRDLEALQTAAERVLAANGKVLAFVESDRILLGSKEVGQLLCDVSNRIGVLDKICTNFLFHR